MWDEPRELNRLTGILLYISAVAILYGALHMTLQLPAFALRAVRLDAEPVRVNQQHIRERVLDTWRGNFFTLNLDQARQSLEQLPWVRKASVRRQFPWKLAVRLEEHVPMANWNDTAWVNTHGEIFKVAGGQPDPALPRFYGTPDSAREVAEMYAEFARHLRPLDQRIAQISLSQRRAWQLRLSNGVMLELGTEQLQQRMARYVAAYPYALAPMDGLVKYVDMRYRNGFAVRTHG